MVRSLYLPRPQPEPFRLVAIGVSIALNAALFMALMQPPSSRPPPPPDVPPKIDPVRDRPPELRPAHPARVANRQATFNRPVDAPPPTDASLPRATPYPTDLPTRPTFDKAGAGPFAASQPSVGADPIGSPLVPIATPAPAYPPEALSVGAAGTVELELLVGLDGRVLEVQVVRSSGNRHLDAAARTQVLRHWIFEPARAHGAAAQGLGRVAIVFTRGNR